MGESFKGWRRKTGLVTLAMAMVLTVVWMRSYVVQDDLVVPQQQTSCLSVVSAHGQLGCIHHSDGFWHSAGTILQSTDISTSFGIHIMDDDHLLARATSQWGLVGFRFGAGQIPYWGGDRMEEDIFEFWIIPYWSLVLPLTLVSGWLLLIKPRPAKSGKESSRG